MTAYSQEVGLRQLENCETLEGSPAVIDVVVTLWYPVFLVVHSCIGKGIYHKKYSRSEIDFSNQAYGNYYSRELLKIWFIPDVSVLFSSLPG